MLNQGFAPGSIKLNQAAANWSEAISLAGIALEESGRTTAIYTQQMQDAFTELGPYMVISKGIALAHARPSTEVLSAGLSLVTLVSPVEFGSERFDPVALVFGLAAVDHEGHIDLMAALSELLMDEAKVKILLQAQNESQVRSLFG
ncbi:MAG: PTS sugar transporter subunit IIA [Rhodoluna sp.]